MAHLAFIFCCAVWGTSFILLERVTHVMGPVEIGIWRMFSGAAVVGSFWWFESRRVSAESPRFAVHRRFSSLLVHCAAAGDSGVCAGAGIRAQFLRDDGRGDSAADDSVRCRCWRMLPTGASCSACWAGWRACFCWWKTAGSRDVVWAAGADADHSAVVGAEQHVLSNGSCRTCRLRR